MPASSPEPNRWRRPPILRRVERLATRVYGIALAGYTFYGFPQALPNPELRFIVGLMGGCAPIATFLVIAAFSTSTHQNKLADRLHAETPSSTRVALIFCKGEQRNSVDEGILAFEGGVLRYVGTITTFRLGRSQVELVDAVSDNGQEIMFFDEGEPHRIAFREKGRKASDLAHIFRVWMEHAPIDATFEPPPYTQPPIRALMYLKGIAPWLVAFALVRLQLQLLPSRSPELTPLVLTFLLLLSLIAAITLIQASIASNRVYREPLGLLLDHPRRTEAWTAHPAENPATDATPHQTASR